PAGATRLGRRPPGRAPGPRALAARPPPRRRVVAPRAEAGSPVDGAVPRPAIDDVVAGTAAQVVRGARADDRVIAGPTEDALDVGADVVVLRRLPVVCDTVERDIDWSYPR